MPLLGDHSEFGFTNYFGQSLSCNDQTAHRGCGVTGATGTPAHAICVPVGEEAIDGACIGLCASSEWSNLDCGVGYQCITPAAQDALFLEKQINSDGNEVRCVLGTSSCDLSHGYSCVQYSEGSYCAKPYGVCQTLQN
jgi:hypothetical protein